MKKVFAVLLLGTLSISVNARKNEYMIPGTDAYNKTTVSLIGSWKIDSYAKDKNGEQIGTTYTSGTMTIQELPKPGKAGTAVFSFIVAPQTIAGRIEAWSSKKKDELEVTEYKIITSCQWKLNNDGDILHLDEPQTTCEIAGSGKQLKKFQGFEASFLESASSMKNDGGINSMIGGMVMAKASGTETFTPNIPDQTNFAITDNGMSFTSISKNNFSFSKQ